MPLTPLIAVPPASSLRLPGNMTLYGVVVEGVSHRYKDGRPRIAHVTQNKRRAEWLCKFHRERHGYKAHYVVLVPRQIGGVA